jgi:large subunit GTPase 1
MRSSIRLDQFFLPRRLWADYFNEQGVQYAFFSAANAAALQEARRQALAEAEANETHGDGSSDNLDEIVASEEEDSEEEDSGSEDESESDDEGLYLSEEDSPDSQDPRARVLSVLELEALFVEVAPDLSSV